jgi:hypothetical protein
MQAGEQQSSKENCSREANKVLVSVAVNLNGKGVAG